MVVSYKRLWHLLIDRNMNKTDLKRATGISSSTLANMVAGKNVSMDVLLKICNTLQCDFSDIIEAIPIKLDAFGEPVINKEYDADRLAAAVALHEGFNYQPDAECFWKQSVGNEQSYLFVTTTHISSQHLDAIKNTMQDGEFLIIACKSFDQGIEKAYKEITIKKIPQMLLDRCKFGVTDYNLNIVNPPVYEDEEMCDD